MEWNETGSRVHKKMETRKQVCLVVGFACLTTRQRRTRELFTVLYKDECREKKLIIKQN